MRFTLRTLFALMLTTALIPLVATALTFYIHESPSRREIAILPAPFKRDLHIRGLKGETFLTPEDGLAAHTRVYLRLREMFHTTSTGLRQREKLIELDIVNLSKTSLLDIVHVPEYWYEFPQGIRIRSDKIQVRYGEQSVSFAMSWKPTYLRIAMREKHIYFRTDTPTQHHILALSDEENSLIATTIVDKTLAQENTSRAGSFFLTSLFVIAVPLYTFFLWRILRFRRQTKSPNKNSEIAPA